MLALQKKPKTNLFLARAEPLRLFLLNVVTQMPQDVHVDSLTLGDEFMVHNALIVKNDEQAPCLPVTSITNSSCEICRKVLEHGGPKTDLHSQFGSI